MEGLVAARTWQPQRLAPLLQTGHYGGHYCQILYKTELLRPGLFKVFHEDFAAKVA